MKLLIIFIILNVCNVILQTIKSLATVKCGKGIAALINAVAYGLYTVVLVYTNADFPLFEKVVVVALTNLIGVYVVKMIEEHLEKEKLWKIEATILTNKNDTYSRFCEAMEQFNLSYNITLPDNYSRKEFYVNIYCKTKTESKLAKSILSNYHTKYFVSESKTL